MPASRVAWLGEELLLVSQCGAGLALVPTASPQGLLPEPIPLPTPLAASTSDQAGPSPAAAECATQAMLGCWNHAVPERGTPAGAGGRLVGPSDGDTVNLVSDDAWNGQGGVGAETGVEHAELRDGLPCGFEGLPYLPVTPGQATGLIGSGWNSLWCEGSVLSGSGMWGPGGLEIWSPLGLPGTGGPNCLSSPAHGGQAWPPQGLPQAGQASILLERTRERDASAVNWLGDGLGHTTLPDPFQALLRPWQATMPSLQLGTPLLPGQATIPANGGGLDHSVSMLTPAAIVEGARSGCSGGEAPEPSPGDPDTSPDSCTAPGAASPSAVPLATAPRVAWGEATVGLAVVRARHLPPWVVQVKELGRVCAWQVAEPRVSG